MPASADLRADGAAQNANGRRVVVRRGIWSALAATPIVLTGCLPQSATQQGDSIASLYSIAMIAAAGVAVVVWGLLGWVIVRYRRSPARGDPPQSRGSLPLEVLWTAVPLLMIGVLFALTLATLNSVAGAPASGGVDVRFEAFRWGWRIDYPNAGVAVEGHDQPGPEVVLPVGQPINVTLTATDVIHAFFVPQFLYKRDAIPGHPNQFVVTVDRPGVYSGECAEYCGLLHARMPFTIRGVTPDEFSAWLAAQRAGSARP